MVEKINTSIKPSEEVDKINEIIDAVVYKTGNQQVSGEKRFRDIIYRQNSEDDYTTAPAELVGTHIGIIDKNNVWLGGWEHYHHNNGNVTKSMAVRQQNGDSYAILGVGIKPDGTQYTFAPACDGTDSIVTTVNMNKTPYNSYVKLGNGIIIQWGYTQSTSGTINFGIPFSSDARVCMSCRAGVPNVTSTNTTSFSYNCYEPGSGGSAIWWIAIGY